MSIVFEEEQKELEKDEEIAKVRNVSFTIQNYKNQPIWQKLALLVLVICFIGGAVAIQIYYNPFAVNKLNAVYREDVTESDLRLIPAQDRAIYLNSLPTRK